MPNLACRACGRMLYTVAPLDALFAEERRCPRCGAFMDPERREQERRFMHRRANPAEEQAPPAGERRSGAERRTRRRRQVQ